MEAEEFFQFDLLISPFQSSKKRKWNTSTEQKQIIQQSLKLCIWYGFYQLQCQVKWLVDFGYLWKAKKQKRVSHPWFKICDYTQDLSNGLHLEDLNIDENYLQGYVGDIP